MGGASGCRAIAGLCLSSLLDQRLLLPASTSVSPDRQLGARRVSPRCSSSSTCLLLPLSAPPPPRLRSMPLCVGGDIQSPPVADFDGASIAISQALTTAAGVAVRLDEHFPVLNDIRRVLRMFARHYLLTAGRGLALSGWGVPDALGVGDGWSGGRGGAVSGLAQADLSCCLLPSPRL